MTKNYNLRKKCILQHKVLNVTTNFFDATLQIARSFFSEMPIKITSFSSL